MARGAQIAVITRYVGDDGPFYEDRAFLHEIRAINKKFAQRMRRSFGETVRTWEDKPKFRQETETHPEPAVAVYTEDEVYGYVSGGTRVRRAVMSQDFSPKTRPGQLRARPGRGGVVFISRKIELPGIEAREFPAQVEDRHQGEYADAVNAAIDRALRRTRWAKKTRR